jgi:CubicO group peptidase (beta-lactamase class C family)
MTTVSINAAKLDSLFAPFASNDRPGLAVGIAHRGVPIYRRGFGLASTELPVTLSPHIRMRIGSTSKQFTCLCIMLLAEEGKLAVDDSVRKHLPDLGDWADTVTLAGLMSHTSGTRCSLDILAATQNVMGSGTPLPHEEQLALLTRLRTTNFPAGTNWTYSNGGYVLLTHVIARVSGQTYEEFLQTRILNPVGMVDSFARPTDTDCAANSATLHVPDPSGGFKRGIFGPAIGGEGSIVSTINDMLLWLRHMASPTVGSAETWRQMRTPVLLEDGTNTNYGFGLMIKPYRGVDTIAHTGGVIGGASQMLKVVEHDLDIVIIANFAGVDPGALVNQVIDLCIEGLEPDTKVDQSTPGPFPTGDFFGHQTNRHARILDRDGQPFLNLMPAEMPLTRHADGSLSLMGMITFTPVEGGIDVDVSGVTERLIALEKPDADGFAAISGAWHSDELGITITIDQDGAMQTKGQHGRASYRLEAVGRGVWAAIHPLMGGGATLLLEEGELIFSSSRSYKMAFLRA